MHFAGVFVCFIKAILPRIAVLHAVTEPCVQARFELYRVFGPTPLTFHVTHRLFCGTKPSKPRVQIRIDSFSLL